MSDDELTQVQSCRATLAINRAEMEFHDLKSIFEPFSRFDRGELDLGMQEVLNIVGVELIRWADDTENPRFMLHVWSCWLSPIAVPHDKNYAVPNSEAWPATATIEYLSCFARHEYNSGSAVGVDAWHGIILGVLEDLPLSGGLENLLFGCLDRNSFNTDYAVMVCRNRGILDIKIGYLSFIVAICSLQPRALCAWYRY
jgi:hypothetical protein